MTFMQSQITWGLYMEVIIQLTAKTLQTGDGMNLTIRLCTEQMRLNQYAQARISYSTDDEI